jgi:hypothetical protein
MKHKVGSRRGISRQPVDLLNRDGGTSNSHGSTQIQVLLNWFSKACVNLKFKYNVSNLQWIDVDSIISTVTLSYCSVLTVNPNFGSLASSTHGSMNYFLCLATVEGAMFNTLIRA